MQISQQIEQLTETSRRPGVQKVTVAQSGILSRGRRQHPVGGTVIAIIFVLSLFLLASGTMFYEKIIQSFARLSEKKRALRVVYDVEREISHYLLTVAVINAGLGVAVGLGLWALGMPNPLVWGDGGGTAQFPALCRRADHDPARRGDRIDLVRQHLLRAAGARLGHACATSSKASW